MFTNITFLQSIVLASITLKYETHLLYFIHFDVYPLINFFNDNSLSYKIHVSKDSCVYELFERYIEILDSNRIADKMEIKSILIIIFILFCSMWMKRENELL